MAGSRLLHRLRRFRRRVQRFVFSNVLHADDPPHRLALGVAIGIFVTFTPTIGFQMALVVFLAWLLRANKVVGVPLVWITNPATIVPIYYPCYVVGRVLLGHESIGWEWWMELTRPPVDGWWPTVQFYWGRTVEIAAPLWLGCIVVASLLAVLTYAAVSYAVRAYRLRRWGQLTPPRSRRAAARTPGAKLA